MNKAKPSDIKCSRAYWTHGVEIPYTLKAQHRLAELVEYDTNLTRAARMVFHFITGWDMEKYGDALASARFISSALKARDPAGVGLSTSAVNTATALLIKSGWLTQTIKGTGPKNASRYVPAWNALTAAASGQFPSIVAEASTHSGQRLTHFRRA